jgi:predicted DsbA family dithiol-disulfide isomerase
MKVTMYLEVTSSWCFWAEPAWEEIKRRYAGRVDFAWKIALMPLAAHPVSPVQRLWFYRRSGTIMRSPFLLNAHWAGSDLKQSVVPNLVAEAGRDFPGVGEKIRLALGHAALREGRHVWDWNVATEIAAAAGEVDRFELMNRAKSQAVEARVEASTAEFDALKITQRPAFVLDNNIEDRAVFSGVVKPEPIAATIEAMLADEAAYASYSAHFGNPPPR